MPYASVNGTRLYYEDTGGGPSLLFIHGASADAGRWAGQIARLCPSFRCVAYDRRGSSRSAGATARDVDPRVHAEDAAGLVRHLRLKPCTLVATSQGGHIGLDLMLRYPELLRGAVLNEPIVLSLDREGAGAFRAGLRTVVELAHVAGGPRAAVDAYMTYSDPDGWAVTPEPDRDRLRGNHDGLFRALGTTLPEITPADLATIPVPTLVVIGTQTHDFFRRSCERVAAGIPGARVVEIEGAGHHTYMRAPDLFAEIVRGFAASSGGGLRTTVHGADDRDRIPLTPRGPAAAR